MACPECGNEIQVLEVKSGGGVIIRLSWDFYR